MQNNREGQPFPAYLPVSELRRIASLKIARNMDLMMEPLLVIQHRP
jgi:hypothetical protein